MFTKRPRSPSAEPSDRVAKRRAATEATAPAHDEDDLADILAQIQQHEESEALARKLQAEWDGLPSTDGETSGFGVDTPGQREQESLGSFEDDDEAFARRLAAQWAEEDGAAAQSPHLPSPSSLQAGKDIVRKIAATSSAPAPRVGYQAEQDTQRELLQSYRGFFIGSKNCTECGHELLSPRGYVRSLGYCTKLITNLFTLDCGHLRWSFHLKFLLRAL